MASKKKVTPPALNMDLLRQIAAATASGGFLYVSAEDGKPLLDQELIIQNGQLVEQGTNKIATKTTEKGNAMSNGTATDANAAPAASDPSSNYQIFSGVVLPPSKRGGNRGAGAPMKYPFDKLEIGQGFFEAVSAKVENPYKTLSSTVSSVNKRYSEPTGESKQVIRTVRGPGNKAVLNADGTKQKQTVTVPVTKQLRKFTVRAVKAGDKLGEVTIPADGAFVTRVAVE